MEISQETLQYLLARIVALENELKRIQEIVVFYEEVKSV